jgi:hypothetical protein
MQLLKRTGIVYCAVLFIILFVHDGNSISLQKIEKIKVENIRQKLIDGDVVITYDLNGPPDAEYTLKIILKRRSNNNFQYKPKNISGDIGKGLFSGKDRQIIWKISKEFPTSFFSNDLYFDISIEQMFVPTPPSDSNTLLWIGAGAALVGGGVAVYYLFLKPKPAESFPDPPNVRPY